MSQHVATSYRTLQRARLHGQIGRCGAAPQPCVCMCVCACAHVCARAGDMFGMLPELESWEGLPPFMPTVLEGVR